MTNYIEREGRKFATNNDGSGLFELINGSYQQIIENNKYFKSIKEVKRTISKILSTNNCFIITPHLMTSRIAKSKTLMGTKREAFKYLSLNKPNVQILDTHTGETWTRTMDSYWIKK